MLGLQDVDICIGGFTKSVGTVTNGGAFAQGTASVTSIRHFRVWASSVAGGMNLRRAQTQL